MPNAAVLFLLVVVLAVVWFTQGGLPITSTGPANTPQSQGSTQSSETQNGTAAGEKIEITLSSGSAQSANSADDEYIELRVSNSNKKPVGISGWRLENKDGDKYFIPSGSKLAYSARANTEAPITLEPNAKAYITTGKSPINASFLLNSCMGFFNEQYQFKPSIYTSCPAPEKEPGATNQKDACYSYLKTLGSCKTPSANPPLNIDSDCRQFLDQRINYAGCVEAHRNDSNFYGNEWRIYLGQKEEAWSNVRENIKLFDQNSNLVAEISY